MTELLDIEGDMDRLDPLQPVYPAALAPSEKLPDVVVVGDAGVAVANRRREEFQEPPCRMLAGVGDERRNHRLRRLRGEGSMGLIGYELAHRFILTCPLRLFLGA